MKRSLIATALVVAMVGGAGAAAGCSGEPAKTSVNADVPVGAAPLMPPTHEGRYESLGANGCYGCHGANDLANPMLTGTSALPENHYANGDPNSHELDPVRTQCITCHVQG